MNWISVDPAGVYRVGRIMQDSGEATLPALTRLRAVGDDRGLGELQAMVAAEVSAAAAALERHTAAWLEQVVATQTSESPAATGPWGSQPYPSTLAIAITTVAPVRCPTSPARNPAIVPDRSISTPAPPYWSSTTSPVRAVTIRYRTVTRDVDDTSAPVPGVVTR